MVPRSLRRIDTEFLFPNSEHVPEHKERKEEVRNNDQNRPVLYQALQSEMKTGLASIHRADSLSPRTHPESRRENEPHHRVNPQKHDCQENVINPMLDWNSSLKFSELQIPIGWVGGGQT